MHTTMRTDQPGAQATLRFSGTGVIVVGDYSKTGAKADVVLDGKPAGEINAEQVPRTYDNVYWHVTGLPSGTHTVQIRARPGQSARQLAIERAVIFGR
jgi:hypothetical protein